LTTNDALGTYLNVFLRDLSHPNTVLVSVPLPGEGPVINADGNSPSISSNGQFVAFERGTSSIGSNGVGFLTRDIYVRDLRTGTTTLASVDVTGTNSGNGLSTAPLITADGRCVFFESAATNLVSNDTNGVIDVFARDLVAGETVLVSADATAAGPPSAGGTGRHHS
jgi:Tol biopolymer transport system component